jgi:two-component system, chemotaxis family, chemotaxis protein CheY
MAYVLVVDDSVSLRKLLIATLAAAGHELAEASNGEEALAAIQQQRPFNLIISDLNMPVMDGLTFIRKVRALATYKFVPILILTTELDPEKKTAAKASGATGWLVKPFDPAQLIGTIRKVLG